MPFSIGSRRPRGPLHQDGTAVRQARQARNITQAALARKARISPSYLSEIESNNRSAPPRTLRKIARALSIDVARLERVRPHECPQDGCAYRFDPPADGLVPLHPAPGGTGPHDDEWCPGGRQPLEVEPEQVQAA